MGVADVSSMKLLPVDEARARMLADVAAFSEESVVF
jgi:hypothetical protein